MPFMTVAFFTENSPYEEEAKKLKKSLLDLSMPMDIVGIPSQGSWQSNCQYKPYFLQEMLIRHFPKNILYLDVDAVVHAQPTLIEEIDADIGLVYLKHPAFEELLSGTIYLANRPNVAELIKRWILGCLSHPAVWDQQVLQAVIGQSKDLNLKINRLPSTYCHIFDFPYGEDVGSPIIEHFQASRRFRK